MFPPLPFFLLSGRGRNTSQTGPFPVCRAGATPRFFWAAKGSQKWGRSSPFRCFAHVQTECRSMRNLYAPNNFRSRSEEHTSELQSRGHLVCRLLLEKKKRNKQHN